MTYVVTDNTGRPVATATNPDDAKTFVYRNLAAVDRDPYATVAWTLTGKLMRDGKFTGWEIREVAEVAAVTQTGAP
jgi:hypothetical protein